jgi:hypothetical protein
VEACKFEPDGEESRKMRSWSREEKVGSGGNNNSKGRKVGPLSIDAAIGALPRGWQRYFK